MSVQETGQNESTEEENEFSSLEANNFIRGNKAGCLVITEQIQGEEVETVYITVNRTYFELREFGPPSKCKRFTMSEALNEARDSETASARLAAYPQASIDIESKIEFIKDNFELEDKESKAGYGLSRDELDDAEPDGLEIASKPIDTSAEHGGGW